MDHRFECVFWPTFIEVIGAWTTDCVLNKWHWLYPSRVKRKGVSVSYIWDVGPHAAYLYDHVQDGETRGKARCGSTLCAYGFVFHIAKQTNQHLWQNRIRTIIDGSHNNLTIFSASLKTKLAWDHNLAPDMISLFLLASGLTMWTNETTTIRAALTLFLVKLR